MFQKIKRFFYFPIAGYFRFFAQIRLQKWHPRVIVITGSSGKTTLLHLVESQLGKLAKYSHEANSSFGIPFNILGLARKNLKLAEWPMLFLTAPLKVFSKLPDEKIYVVEADCDRVYEGEFLSSLLKPEVTLWVNVSRTHSMGFEKAVSKSGFKSVDEAIAHEFGFFAERTQKLLMIPDNSPLIAKQLSRVKCEIRKVKADKDPSDYLTSYLLPKVTGISFKMCLDLTDYLEVKPDLSFSKFNLPPGRSSIFKGVKEITIVDSTYNANFDSMRAVLTMFAEIKAKVKWAVLGDMLEQGRQEKEEHEKLAREVAKYNFEKVILMGPRVSSYTYPLLTGDVVKFLGPKEVLEYLNNNLKGGETILFKGARFLEGVIENLLLDKADTSKLVRREVVWEKRRKKFGL